MTPAVRLSPRGVTPAGCGVPGIRSCKHTCPAASSRHLAALAKPLAKANAARTSLLCHHPARASPIPRIPGPHITRPAHTRPAHHPACLCKSSCQSCCKGQGLCAHSVATFCVATECRAFLSSGATTYRRGARDLFEVPLSSAITRLAHHPACASPGPHITRPDPAHS